jgi:hypothetical protein
MSQTLYTFIRIMLFYIFLSYIIFPIAFYYYYNKSLKHAGVGYIIGSIISINLWCFYGSEMI